MRQSETAIDPFLMVRTTVEAQIAPPGVLTVSSAVSGDGKTGVATGIVRSLVTAGYRTLAIDAGASTPHAISVESAAALVADAARPVAAGCDFVSLSPEQARTASAAAIDAFYRTIRARYDYAVVDAAIVGSGGLAFARAADGVVLALREGRAASDADRVAVQLFERLRVRFLGVVATHEETPHDRSGPQALYDRLQPRPRRVALSVDEPARGVAFGRSAV
jgi:Mrp family chromosome partitioning ATPase